MIEVFPVRKMCLLSFLLLLLTLPFLVHGSASAQTETLRVMVYDRENMPEEYGSCEDNAWVRYIQSRVLRELDIDLQFVRVKRADDVRRSICWQVRTNRRTSCSPMSMISG